MRKSAVAAAVGLALAAHAETARSLPEGGQVSAGQGTIGTPSNGALVVKQDSQRLAIDWLKFSIRAGESVHFDQPGASAIALNRVLGTEASQIYGRLSATGQVFLLNPNGVLFAPGSQVNVGGLVASTLGLSNEEFMAGRFQFKKDGKAGAVVNQGEITAGYAALLGPQVSNEGVITATLGTVALAAGEQVTLNLNGTSLLGLSVDKGALDALAANKQLIRADGGTVILTAKATDDILRSVVNNDGIIEARTISARDGVIRLESTGSGITAVNGALEAKSIIVTGDKVGLYDHAQLVAPSGAILVGGNFQGKGPERNSTGTYVAPGATLNADAAGEGDGGKVIVWSDGITRFYGHLSSKGGERGGDGGFAEVSGKGQLIYRGSVDLSAPHGRAGRILFDPKDIIIANTATPDTVATNDQFAENSSGTVTFDADSITAITNTGAAVTLQANNDITVNEAIISNNPGGNGGAITMQAGRSIAINQNITTDNGDLTLVANESLANGVVDAQRDLGVATILMSGAVNAGTGTVNITIRAGDDKTNHDAGEIHLGPITAATLDVTNAGVAPGNHDIRQTGPLVITGTASFNAGAGLIDLGSGTNDFQGRVHLASTGFGQPHQIWDGNDLQLGTVTFDPFATLTIETGTNGGATGHVTQAGAMTAQFVTVYTFAPLSDIKLDQANQISDTTNPFRFNGSGAWRDLSLRNDTGGGSWRLNHTGNWQTIRNLTIVSASEIRQTNPITVTGSASFNAGAQGIDLSSGTNDFQGPVSLASTSTAFGHQVWDANNLQLGTVNFASFGANLTVETGTGGGATGHVTQTGPITAEFVNVFTFAPISDIALDGANMITDTTNPFRLRNFGTGAWGDVSLRNEFGAGAWSINHTNQWDTIGGNLTIRSVNPIAQGNAITVAGTASFDSDLAITVDHDLNDFQGTVNVRSGTAGFSHHIADANNLRLGTIDIGTTGELFVQTGGAGMFGTVVTGNLTQTVPLDFHRLHVSTYSISTSDIVLDMPNNMLRSTTDAFLLSNNNSLAGGTWRNVSLRNDFGLGAYSVNSNNGWTTVTGDLTVRTLTGITQGSPVSVVGTASFNPGSGLLDLQQTGNDFQGVVNLQSTANAGTHRLTDGSNLRLGTISVDINSHLQLQTGGVAGNTGNLTQTVPLNLPQLRVQTLSDTSSDILLNLANMMSFTTEPFVLDNVGTGTWGNVSLRNDFGAGAFSVNQSNQWATITGNLSIQALTGITQANPISVGGTSRFETVSSQIQLTQNNDFQDTVTLIGGTNVHVRQGSANDLKVAPVTAQQLQLVSAASGIDLFAGTYASSAGALTLNASTTIDLTTGPVTFSGTAGISVTGDVAGPGALVMNQTGAAQSTNVIGSLGTPGVPLGGLTIDHANTFNLSLGDVNATGAVSVETAGNLILPPGTLISSGAAGNAIVLATGGDFVNNAGAGALSAASGRWLIYSTSPAGSTEGGLTGAAGSAIPRLYNRTFAANGPGTITEPGNHLIYSAQPSLNVAADSFARVVGAPNPPLTFSVSGYLVDDGFTDSGAAFSGALTTTALVGSPAGLYPITQGTLASGTGYGLSFAPGALTVNGAVIVPPPAVQVSPAASVSVVIPAIQAYLDTLAGIQGNRVAAPMPVEYSELITIENGGMRLPEGLKP